MGRRLSRNITGPLQCFHCQQFGHKAQFCSLQEKCVKCAGSHNTEDCKKPPTTPPKCVNCQGEHPANYRQCPNAENYRTRFQRRPRPQIAEFPQLPTTETRIPGFALPSPPPAHDYGLANIIKLFTTGTVSHYIRMFKELMASVQIQPDSISKITTFCTGVFDMINSSNGQP